jgi:hypothetical protein
METRSAKYPATPSGVKRGLKSAKLSQRRAALATDQSPSLVCMVLKGDVKSQPCLDKIAALINKTLVEREREGAAA